MKILFTLGLLCCLYWNAFAQPAGWTLNPYDDRYFIENIGQYAPMLGEQVACGVDNLGTEIFYLPSGFAYRVRKPVQVPAYLVADGDEETPENEAEDHSRIAYDTLQIQGHWLGAQRPEIRLEAPQTPLFHFAHEGKQLFGAKSYAQLRYNGLYDNIDVDYGFHTTEGIKYNITVHPGGDVAQIALQYVGTDRCFLDANGNLHAELNDAALIDHAPKAYLLESGTAVPVQFVLSGNVVRFDVAPYDRAQTLFIDPWTINPGFTTDTKVFDVTWDCSSNVYAFGGSSPWKVKKFNSAGTLQWTYNTSHTSWYGDIISDDVGNTYITEGCCNGNRQKLSAAGAVIWSINNGTFEFWRLVFNCDFTKLTMANAYSSNAAISPTNSLNTINLATGIPSGQVAAFANEPRSIAIDPIGNYYSLIAVGNQIVANTSTYGPIYAVGNGYSLLYNGPLYSNGSNTTQGANGIAVYSTFAFTTDGATLMKRNLATGALISSAAIPGGVAEQYSGVAVDNCGNVYVGSNANVYRYDVNLAPVSSLAVTGAVYDVAISGTAQLLIAGNGFLSAQTAPCVAVCPTCIILPQEFTNWTAEANSLGQVDLSWSMATPAANASFRIERSADALHFIALDSVQADHAIYAYVDAAPLQGNAWYRLVYRDAAGTLKVSTLRQVTITENAMRMIVYPNPADDELHLRFSEVGDQWLDLQVVNAQGQWVLQRRLKAVSSNTIHTIGITDLPDGIYTLRIVGNNLAPVKFVKQSEE
jgi:hypothetical protein